MEGPEDSGLAHLFEHMLFRPNQILTTEERLTARKLELGIGIFGGTHEEVVRFGVTTHATNLEAALGFLRDMLLSPHFDEKVLAAEKVVIGNEERQRSGPAALFSNRMAPLLWRKHPTRKSTLGVAESLPSLTVADLRRTWERYYVPSNAAVVVVGDVQVGAVIGAAERLFGEWKPGRTAPRLPAPASIPRWRAARWWSIRLQGPTPGGRSCGTARRPTVRIRPWPTPLAP